MKTLLTLTALMFAALTTQAQAQSPSSTQAKAPFGDGEELLYNVSYRAALIPNINIMRVSIRTLAEELGGAPHFHVIGNGRTFGTIKSVFELNDTYHSWLDAASLRPTRMTSDIRENDYRFRATYNYDWNTMTVSNTCRNPNWDADSRYTYSIPGAECGDALSLFFMMRAIDASSLVSGTARTLNLALERDSKPIILRFIGREEVKVRKLGTFRALKFTCTMATSDGSTYEEGMTLTAWISDDENHIPLMVESPVRVGRVSVTLAEGFKVLRPLASRVN